MSDIRILYNANIMAADVALMSGLLAGEDGLETAVILSLFTDRRARPDDVLPNDNRSRRGWWGDLAPARVDGAAVDNDRIGSRLWLLEREKQLPNVLVRAKDYAEESLAWLIEDGVAERIEVETSIVRNGVLGIGVVIYRPEGDPVDFRYDYSWAAQAVQEAA